MKHIAGNLRSRFTDFRTTDGEKPDRNRDGEFEIAGHPGRTGDHGGLGERLVACSSPASTRCRADDLLKGSAGPRRGAARPGPAQSPDDPPRLPRSPDCLSRQAFTVGRVDEPEHSSTAAVLAGYRFSRLCRTASRSPLNQHSSIYAYEHVVCGQRAHAGDGRAFGARRAARRRAVARPQPGAALIGGRADPGHRDPA